ncbi:hypothetical protein IQ277_21490 [Nostocales cyanobacterium LEGE 12452]|nr:hypothetical protein [Nostocales cyanobacterium LEGE 12452]
MTESKDEFNIQEPLLKEILEQLGNPESLEELNKKLAEPESRAKFIINLFADIDVIETIKATPQGESQRLALEEIISFRTTLTEETDRGCALMASAYLDSELEKLIKAKLVNNENVAKELFTQNGSLGSFSARINFAYLLGLISNTTKRNLNILRKIRNEFAHIASPLSFKTPDISSRCNELRGLGLSKNLEPRSRFIRCMMNTVALIHCSFFKVSHIEEQQDLYEQKKDFLEEELNILSLSILPFTSKTSEGKEE